MAIDDVATTLEKIVSEIHRQLGDIPPPIPIYEIARALDIHEIQETPLNSFEGILITDAARDFGIIGVNKDASYERKRYSVGHELGHFLCQWHVQTQDRGFRCSKQDMALPAIPSTFVRKMKPTCLRSNCWRRRDSSPPMLEDTPPRACALVAFEIAHQQDGSCSPLCQPAQGMPRRCLYQGWTVPLQRTPGRLSVHRAGKRAGASTFAEGRA